MRACAAGGKAIGLYEKRDLIAQKIIFAFTAPQKYTFPALHIGVCFASLSASVPEIRVFKLAQHAERADSDY